VTAHQSGQRDVAAECLQRADMPEVRAWLNAIWSRSPKARIYAAVPGAPAVLSKSEQSGRRRMPDQQLKGALLARDGFHCRLCSMPVIRAEVRDALKALDPDAVTWGRSNASQHAALQAMWLQYDHVLPFSRGGETSLSNLVVACAACNFGREDCTLEETRLQDPRERAVVRSSWDGLERLLA
jgi:5-methylcytosine-specific restriction endonuclease McrA